MRARDFKLIALVVVFQLAMMLALDNWARKEVDWVERACFISAYVIPFIAYLVFFYGAPIFAKMSSIPKMICLTLMSYAMVFAGTMIVLMLWVVISLITGLPLGR